MTKIDIIKETPTTVVLDANDGMASQEINHLKSVVLFIAKLMGRDTEVVLHDIKERKLIFIVNSHITGRKEGYRFDRAMYDLILSLADADGHVIGYKSTTIQGKTLRSSHLIIKDESGEPQALICVNQDIEKLQTIRNVIDSMIEIKPLSVVQSVNAEDGYIQNVTKKVIIDTIERVKPMPIDTKEGRMEILRALEVQGVFSVKDAVPLVCGLLSISQATLYNYLREICTLKVFSIAESAACFYFTVSIGRSESPPCLSFLRLFRWEPVLRLPACCRRFPLLE